MAPSHISRIERGERRLPNTRLEAIAKALGSTPAALYAMAEGREPPVELEPEEGDASIDYTPEAVQLRRTFRDLNEDERGLVLDFARMLISRRR